MSHIVQIKTEVREPASIRAACIRNRLPEPVHSAESVLPLQAEHERLRAAGAPFGSRRLPTLVCPQAKAAA